MRSLFSNFIIALFVAVLLIGCEAERPGASLQQAVTPSAASHGFTLGPDAIGVGSTLQFTPVDHEPIACTAQMRGTLALTQRMRLCVCDGEAWTFEDTGARCAWNVNDTREDGRT
jgi:hypothetical protein